MTNEVLAFQNHLHQNEDYIMHLKQIMSRTHFPTWSQVSD